MCIPFMVRDIEFNKFRINDQLYTTIRINDERYWQVDDESAFKEWKSSESNKDLLLDYAILLKRPIKMLYEPCTVDNNGLIYYFISFDNYCSLGGYYLHPRLYVDYCKLMNITCPVDNIETYVDDLDRDSISFLTNEQKKLIEKTYDNSYLDSTIHKYTTKLISDLIEMGKLNNTTLTSALTNLYDLSRSFDSLKNYRMI